MTKRSPNRTDAIWPTDPSAKKSIKNKAQPESEADQNSKGTITKGAAAREGKRGYLGEEEFRGWWCMAVLGGAASAVAARNG